MTPSALAFFASFTTLAKILVVSLLVRDQAVAGPYVLFALVRISAFSLSAGLLAFVLAPVLQRHLAALLLGLVFGLTCAATYIMSAG